MLKIKSLKQIIRRLVPLTCVAFAVDCQGGYPLPATDCDDWCEATQRGKCPADDPVECVATCEAANKGEVQRGPRGFVVGPSRTKCPHEVDKLVACLMSAPDAVFSCDYEQRTQTGTCPNEQIDVQT